MCSQIEALNQRTGVVVDDPWHDEDSNPDPHEDDASDSVKVVSIVDEDEWLVH